MVFSSEVRCPGGVRRDVEVAKSEDKACRPVWRRLARLTLDGLLWLDLVIAVGFLIFLRNILEGFAVCGAAMYCLEPCVWRDGKDIRNSEGDRGAPDARFEDDSAPQQADCAWMRGPIARRVRPDGSWE